MARYQVILKYDGTAFHGMQRQANARSVQGVVEKALRRIGWEGSSILAAGRTDAGVHAAGQVVAFDFEWQHSPEDLKNALNATLPEDVAAGEVKITTDDFHPRFAATGRTYQYRILCQPDRNPLGERFAWRIWPLPDFAILEVCARHFLGTHDFAAYGTPPVEEGTTIRQVFKTGWEAAEDNWLFTVSANAFLYHMVRRMVHFMIEIGQGRQPFELLERSLSGEKVEMIQGLAPARGLCLFEVTYPPEVVNDLG